MNTIVLAAQAAQGGGMGMIIMMVAIFAIMYFFMIRPQQKQQKKIREFQNALKGYFEGSATLDEALDQFYKAAEEKYPELSH